MLGVCYCVSGWLGVNGGDKVLRIGLHDVAIDVNELDPRGLNSGKAPNRPKP